MIKTIVVNLDERWSAFRSLCRHYFLDLYPERRYVRFWGLEAPESLNPTLERIWQHWPTATGSRRPDLLAEIEEEIGNNGAGARGDPDQHLFLFVVGEDALQSAAEDEVDDVGGFDLGGNVPRFFKELNGLIASKGWKRHVWVLVLVRPGMFSGAVRGLNPIPCDHLVVPVADDPAYVTGSTADIRAVEAIRAVVDLFSTEENWNRFLTAEANRPRPTRLVLRIRMKNDRRASDDLRRRVYLTLEHHYNQTRNEHERVGMEAGEEGGGSLADQWKRGVEGMLDQIDRVADRGRVNTSDMVETGSIPSIGDRLSGSLKGGPSSSWFRIVEHEARDLWDELVGFFDREFEKQQGAIDGRIAEGLKEYGQLRLKLDAMSIVDIGSGDPAFNVSQEVITKAKSRATAVERELSLAQLPMEPTPVRSDAEGLPGDPGLISDKVEGLLVGPDSGAYRRFMSQVRKTQRRSTRLIDLRAAARWAFLLLAVFAIPSVLFFFVPGLLGDRVDGGSLDDWFVAIALWPFVPAVAFFLLAWRESKRRLSGFWDSVSAIEGEVVKLRKEAAKRMALLLVYPLNVIRRRSLDAVCQRLQELQEEIRFAKAFVGTVSKELSVQAGIEASAQDIDRKVVEKLRGVREIATWLSLCLEQIDPPQSRNIQVHYGGSDQVTEESQFFENEGEVRIEREAAAP